MVLSPGKAPSIWSIRRASSTVLATVSAQVPTASGAAGMSTASRVATVVSVE